jgi:tetratricopeptide (TPR) repeat protein
VDQAVDAFNEKASELSIPLSYGREPGTIKAATKEGFTIQTRDGQADVHYSKVEPKMLHSIYRRLPLDADSLIGLAIFCYSNKMSQEAEQVLDKALAEGTPDQKAKIAKYQEGKENLQEAGSPEAVSAAYRAEQEARDLYEAAVLNLAAGETTDALRKLQSVVETYANTTLLKKARELIVQYQAGDKTDDGPPIKLIEPGQTTEKGDDDLEEETGPSTGSGSAGEADRLYQKAKALYAKAAPGMPNWQKFNADALKCLEQAISMYRKAMEEDPENPVLADKMADANRLAYSLKKSRPIK